jgi:signal transduction histidine kinase
MRGSAGVVLVVDDTLESLRLVTRVLKGEGYDVRPADSGELALASAVGTPPDLILLDIRMPDMDGFEVFRRLAANDSTRKVPVIFLSAATEVSDRVEGLRLGAVDFVAKPFEPDELIARVRIHIELHRLRASLEDMVAERTAALQKSLAELEVASSVKNAFLASMSHELRTPLNSVIGFSGTLTSGLAGPLNDEQLRQVRMISTAGNHLLELVNTVLDLSRIEAGVLEAHPRRFDVADLAASTVESLRPASEAKGLALTAEVDPAVGPCESDPTMIGQILMNLLDNAVKYTDEGTVHLNVQREGSSIVFAVSDSGRGIDRKDRDRVFDYFEQALPKDAEMVGGAGLGLALSRRLASLLGGSITLDSAVGKGSTFTLRVPQAG